MCALPGRLRRAGGPPFGIHGGKAMPAAPLRILIAEDNEDLGASLKLTLEGMGYDVHIAIDGAKAVQAAADLRPDVILMDIGLPFLNGYDATGQIRARPGGRSIAIVALTAWDRDTDVKLSIRAGMDHHLAKPLNLAALCAILDSAVRRKEERTGSAGTVA